MYFRLYSNIKAVSGVKRSILYDLQLSKFYFVPNSLLYVLKKCYHNDVQVFKDQLPVNEKKILEDYLEFLVSNELGFFLNKTEANHFPKISLDYFQKSKLTNLVIDISNTEDSVFCEIVDLIDQYLITSILLDIKAPLTIIELEPILDKFNSSALKDIQIIIPFHEDLSDKDSLSKLLLKHLRVSKMDIYNSTMDEIIYFNQETSSVVYRKDEVNLKTMCGKISESSFSVNADLFIENQHVNSCLSGKLFIGPKGEIQPCPSIDLNLGRISDIDQILDSKYLNDLWGINKEQISVCKVCEYRYMCTDCRAYLVDPKDILSKPLKCGYDPYSAEWNDDSLNPLKEKGIEYGSV